MDRLSWEGHELLGTGMAGVKCFAERLNDDQYWVMVNNGSFGVSHPDDVNRLHTTRSLSAY